MPNRRVAISAGDRFGRLVAVEDVGSSKNGSRLWRCVCDCGNETVVTAGHLKRYTRSCGCLKREVTANGANRKHSMSGTKVWRCWVGIHVRCFNTLSVSYERYGGRGITICEAWKKTFQAFYESMGDAPGDEYSVERIDNDGHYSCGKCPECIANGWVMNCKWATRHEQCRNKRNNRMFTIDGVEMCLTDWCRVKGVNPSVVRKKLSRGMPIEQALKRVRKKKGETE